MFIQLTKDSFIEKESVIFAEREGSIITFLMRNSQETLDVLYSSEEECEEAFKLIGKQLCVSKLERPRKVKGVVGKKTETEIKEGLFETFWSMYNKKTGYSSSKKKFMSFGMDKIKDIMICTPTYVSRTPEIKYRKNPLTWLNGSYWEDEKKPEDATVADINFDHNNLF